MEAVILAAGLGSRLGHHTCQKPKAMLKIGGRPLIHYILSTLKKHGIRDILVVTGHRGYVLEEYLEKFDLNFKFIHNSLYWKTNNIYSLHLAMEYIDDGFYLINSDLFFHPDIFSLLKSSSKKGLIIAVDTLKKLGEEEMKVKLDGELVKKISKLLNPSEADGEYIGLARVDKNIVEDLRKRILKVMDEKGKKVFYEEAFQSLIDSGVHIYFESTNGLPWIEIDTPEDLIAARRRIFPMIKY